MAMQTLSGFQLIQDGGATARPAQSSQQAPTAGTREAQRLNRDQLREQIREQVRSAVTAAQQAEAQANAQADAQGDVALPPVPVVPPEPGRTLRIRGPNGEQTIIGIPPAGDMIPPQAVDISVAFFLMIAVIIIGLPLARAFARRMDRKSAGTAQVPAEVTAQLTQLGQAVDAIALEVERISEGQRFTTRLLSEQRDAARQTLPSGAQR